MDYAPLPISYDIDCKWLFFGFVYLLYRIVDAYDSGLCHYLGFIYSRSFSLITVQTSLTTLAFTDTPASQTTAANTLYSTIQQMSTGMGIAMGAVVLRFSNIINHGIAGHYTIPDFRLAFIFVTVLGFVHLYGYTKLSKDAGSVVMLKKKIF